VISNYKQPRSRLGQAPPDLPFDSTASARNDGYELYWDTFTTKESISLETKVRSLLRFELDSHRDKSEFGTRVVHKILVEEFDPPPSYVEKMFNQDATQKYLKDSRYKKPIYMVCGLKTALGGGVTVDGCDKSLGYGATLEGKASAKGLVDIASLKAKFAKEKGKGSHHEVKATQKFIFAYRLRCIKYNKKLKDKPYTEEVLEFHGNNDYVPDDVDPEDLEPSLQNLLEYTQGYEIADPDYDDPEMDPQETSEIEGEERQTVR
jgi:hypothetical protein